MPGVSGATPVVSGDRVFVSSIDASRNLQLLCLSLKTGEKLWEVALPAGGYATPATYAVGGKQFVVIACGGGKMGTKSGDAYVAFTLP